MKNKPTIFAVLVGMVIFLPVGFLFLQITEKVGAITNIHSTSTDHWGWNDLLGWQDFYVGAGGVNSNVYVRSFKVVGVVSSTVGDVVLHC
ncbi:MAG: hypothetical protein AAB594_01595, partial [Patescibacteria group bacterium]